MRARCIVSRMGKGHGLWLLDAARGLTEETLRIVDRLPAHDPSGTRQQLATSVHSVSANIAEGSGRGSTRERLQFLRIARGSLEETQNSLRICVNLGLLEKPTFYRLWNRSIVVGRMLSALMARLERE